MRAGASVALSGLAGGTSAVSLDPIVRPFVEALAALLVGRGINAGEPWVHAVTGLVVLAGGGFGMWLRLRVLSQIDAGVEP